MRTFTRGCAALGLCTVMAGSVFADARLSASKKGSLLIFSKIELKWVCDTGGCHLIQDTFIDMSNDFPDDVWVQIYIVNGDLPLEAVFAGDPPELVEREHPGWNWVDCQFKLTSDQPTYWSVWSGQPVGCQPFQVLDTGFPPGRPDPDDPRQRVLRGFVYAWAVDNLGHEIIWNHLAGDATLINYALGTAWEYNAYAAQACPNDACGRSQGDEPDDTPGRLVLNGVEYDFAYDRLLLDFYAASLPNFPNLVFSGDACIVITDTDLTLHPVSQDLRQDGNGFITTKALFDVWDMNENRKSGTERCISCWDQTLLSRYTFNNQENNLLLITLGTPKGKARINGSASTVCEPDATAAAILGVAAKFLSFQCATGVRWAAAGRTLVGQGIEGDVDDGTEEVFPTIQWDIIAPSEPLQGPVFEGADLESGEPVQKSKAERIGR